MDIVTVLVIVDLISMLGVAWVFYDLLRRLELEL